MWKTIFQKPSLKITYLKKSAAGTLQDMKRRGALYQDNVNINSIVHVITLMQGKVSDDELQAIKGIYLSSQTDGFGRTVAGYWCSPPKYAIARQNRLMLAKIRPCPPKHTNNRRFHVLVIPGSVLGDGNCMCRALFRGLFGTENHHLHVRLLTALKIIQN